MEQPDGELHGEPHQSTTGTYTEAGTRRIEAIAEFSETSEEPFLSWRTATITRFLVCRARRRRERFGERFARWRATITRISIQPTTARLRNSAKSMKHMRFWGIRENGKRMTIMARTSASEFHAHPLGPLDPEAAQMQLHRQIPGGVLIEAPEQPILRDGAASGPASDPTIRRFSDASSSSEASFLPAPGFTWLFPTPASANSSRPGKRCAMPAAGNQKLTT
jgi:hypothetical protein